MLRGAAGILPLFIFLLVALPVLKVLAEVAVPSLETWRSLGPLLPLMLRNTLLLLLGVGAGSFLLGVSLAWLTTAYRFPGSRYFEVLLILPLAVPTYVLGYVYMATFDYAGPFSTAARQLLGITLPEIRSGYGAVAVMSLVLYPYVYVMARAGFRQVSSSSIDVSRVMGYTGLETLIKVALPLSRPAVAAGMALVMMEALTDFATVRFFNFPTLSEGIIRVWYGRMNLEAAMELAGLLLLFALAVVSLEHRLRGRAQYFQTGGGMEKRPLRGVRGAAAAVFCASVLLLAFVLPVLQLTLWALEETAAPSASPEMYLQLLSRSLSLAAAAALVCVLIAIVLAGVLQLGTGRVVRRLARLSTMGYAVPGAVVGVGTLGVLSSFDHRLNSLLEGTLGFAPGLIATGTVVGLIYAYTVKFMTIAYSAVDSSLSRITPSIIGAARSLGARPLEVVRDIQAPMAVPGIAAGAVLVFVDVMKELPITLILRPFGYDTLAVWVWQMAAESLWGGAALPALTIVLAGIIPVAYIIRRGV
ncbi:MAG: iron ABC transporter permease [Euryarchaeota archaeon]|nr:iron ABC transporter permease [Euryarchaeota archaeon]